MIKTNKESNWQILIGNVTMNLRFLWFCFIFKLPGRKRYHALIMDAVELSTLLFIRSIKPVACIKHTLLLVDLFRIDCLLDLFRLHNSILLDVVGVFLLIPIDKYKSHTQSWLIDKNNYTFGSLFRCNFYWSCYCYCINSFKQGFRTQND